MTDWVAATDDTGRTYYYDRWTRRVAWERPSERAVGGAEGSRAVQKSALILREAQEGVHDHTQAHIVSKVQTCLRFGVDNALRAAFREWRRASVVTRTYVPPVARALSSWMVQRDRALAALAGTMLLEDSVELLKLRIEALESAERAQAEFERLACNARSR